MNISPTYKLKTSCFFYAVPPFFFYFSVSFAFNWLEITADYTYIYYKLAVAKITLRLIN